jgi:hypothetical protein
VTSAIFHLRQRSLARGNLLVLGSVLLTFWLSDFPRNRATPLLLIPAIGVILGTIDTARCIRRRWSLQHGGVILCLYMDLLAATLVLFSLLYPYILWINKVH